MENILNLKIYNKYINLIKKVLLLIPDELLLDNIKEVENAYRDKTYKIDKPYKIKNKTHEVILKASKKVRITSRGSLLHIEIDGITYDIIEQTARSIYDPYDEYYDIYYEIRNELLSFSFIPIVDPKYDDIRYTNIKVFKKIKKLL